MLEKLGIEENLEKLSKEVEQEIENQFKTIKAGLPAFVIFHQNLFPNSMI